MKLEFPFVNDIIPDQYGMNVADSQLIDGINAQSFPFSITGLRETTKTVAWKLIDYDTVPMFGFPWTHWLVGDVAVDGSTLVIPADFSRQTTAPQGENSLHSTIQDLRAPWWKLRVKHTWLEQHYAGPRPRSGTHHYQLTVYGFNQSLSLQSGFSLAELMAKLDNDTVTEMAFQNLLYTKRSVIK